MCLRSKTYDMVINSSYKSQRRSTCCCLAFRISIWGIPSFDSIYLIIIFEISWCSKHTLTLASLHLKKLLYIVNFLTFLCSWWKTKQKNTSFFTECLLHSMKEERVWIWNINDCKTAKRINYALHSEHNISFLCLWEEIFQQIFLIAM